MRVLPTSYSDELDVEVDGPEAIMELKEGNFSRLYPVLQEYRKLKATGSDTEKKGLVKRIGSAISGKKKKKPAGKTPDFKRINFVFPDNILDDWETHSRLDGMRKKFGEYCALERKKEEKSAETLDLVKDCMVFGGTIAVTYGLGFAAYLGYIAVLKETPLLISAAADVVLAAGFVVRHKEMAHRDKVGKIEMVDDAELVFTDRDGYEALVEERKTRPKQSHVGHAEDKPPEATRTIEINCGAFFEDGKNDDFSIDGLVDAYRKACPEKKKESVRKRLSDYINGKIRRKKDAGTPPEPGERLRIMVYAKEGCKRSKDLQGRFRSYCRNERMKAEKTADTVEYVKDLVTFAGPVATTYGLSLAVYEGMIAVAKHMPLIIDTAADGVLVSGLIPRKVEIGYRETAKLLEKFESAEIELVPPPYGHGCPRKGFYSHVASQA